MKQINPARHDGRPWPNSYSGFQGIKAGQSTVYLYNDDRKKLKEIARERGNTFSRLLQVAVDEYLQREGN